MLLRRTVAATSLPVTRRDAYEHLRQLDGVDAYLVDGIVAAAVEMVGEMSGRVLAPETWELALPTASGDVALPKSPVQSVASIQYYDATDTLQPAVVADFYLFKDDDRALLRPKAGKSWPTVATREDAIIITFVAGYAICPPALRSAVLMTVTHFYENRGAISAESPSELPMGVQHLVDLFRLNWIAA